MQKCVPFVVIMSLTVFVHPLTFGNDTDGSGDSDPEIARIAVKGGLEASDRERVREAIQPEIGAPLDEKTLEQERERIEGMEGLVVGAVESKAVSDAENKVNVTFRVYYDEVDVELSLSEDGRLSVTLGPDRLFDETPARGGVRRCRGPAAKEKANSWKWVRKAEKSWNAEEQTFEAQHKWGSYSVRYAVRQDRIDLNITIRNDTDSRLRHVGLFLTPGMKFPVLPDGYWWRHNRVMTALPKKGPPVVFGDYGQGVAAACLPGK